MNFSERCKVVILIPTKVTSACRIRSKYLNLTLCSVIDAVSTYGHDAEIVISDTSSPAEADSNAETIRRLHRRNTMLPIHYYPPGPTTVVDSALRRGTRTEQQAFHYLVPQDGHWGAHRNRLALLAVYHGREDAVYLHLDDDTPLLLPGSKGQGVIVRPKEDIVGRFLHGYHLALNEGKVGYAGAIVGVPDGIVSCNRSTSCLKSYLACPDYKFLPQGLGPGRILSFEAMKEPYRPRGLDSDVMHSRVFGKNAYLLTNSEPHHKLPCILHIGVRGVTIRTKKAFEYPSIPRQIKGGWKLLVERISRSK